MHVVCLAEPVETSLWAALGRATCSVHSIFAKTSQGEMESNKAKALTKQQGPNIYWDAPNIHVLFELVACSKTCIFGACQQMFGPFYNVRALKSS